MTDMEMAIEETFVWKDHHTILTQGLWALFVEKYQSDVKLECNGHSLWAHQLILSVFCPNLKTAFTNGSSRVKLDRLVPNGDDLELLVQVLYQGSATLSQDRLDTLQKVAGTLGIKDLLCAIELHKEERESTDYMDPTLQEENPPDLDLGTSTLIKMEPDVEMEEELQESTTNRTTTRKPYIRKTTRGSWSEESLQGALRSIKEKELSILAASKAYGIPRRTLQHRINNKNDKKVPIGRKPVLNQREDMVESKMADHLKFLTRHGFSITMTDVRELAFQLAQKMGIKHTFNMDKEKAGYGWLYAFLGRHPDITVHKTESLPNTRAQVMDRQTIDEFFSILESQLRPQEGPLPPSHIFNADQSALPIISKAGKVAETGAKVVSITPEEKVEIVSLMACISASGTYIPPMIIFKGSEKLSEFENGMPPETVVEVSDSGHMKDHLFLTWLNHFHNHKPSGHAVLIIYGHASHYKNLEATEFCMNNDITMLCVPSHTKHYLQPLDRSVFKSLKTLWATECTKFIGQNPEGEISKLVFGRLFCNAWSKAATVQSAIDGFRRCGIYPINKDEIPEHAYASSEAIDPMHLAGEPSADNAEQNPVRVKEEDQQT